jgi:acyl-CoA dehydrogenase
MGEARHASADVEAAALSLIEGQDHSEIREAVRRICEKFPGEYWRRCDEEEAYPQAFVTALTEAGFLSALIPETYGGSGQSLRAASVILEEIHASGCNAGACHAQMYIMGTLLRHGSEEQKQKYLPAIASGQLRLQAFGITEPTSGSDTSSIRTRAERRGDRYVINGQKVWTSRALHSDLMLVLARTTALDKVTRRTDGLSVFLIDLRNVSDKALHIQPLKAMINHGTTEVFFSGLEVPVENLIGPEGGGFRCILDGMNAERILVASEAIGNARWFIKKAADYARERVVFDRPIGQNQGVQFPIARAYCQTEAADLAVRRAVALFDAGRPCGPEANIAKLLASEAAWEAAEAAMQTFGGYGFAREYDVERKWRETRLFQIAPVSTNLILAFVGHQVLGLPKSY